MAKNSVFSFCLRRVDIVVVGLIFLVAILGVMLVTANFRQEIIQMSIGGRWFQSDGWRVYDDMTSFNANHYRTTLRPLFSLIFIPITALLNFLFGISAIESIWVINGILLGVWCVGIYLACRLLLVSLTGACLIVGLAVCSASVFYWFIVPETYGISSFILVCAILLGAYHIHRPVANRIWIAVGSLLAGTLITNFIIIVALSFTLKSRRDAIYISIMCLFLFFSGWLVQRVVFPKPAAIPFQALQGEKQFILHNDQGGVGCKLAGEFIHPILAVQARFSGAVESTGARLTMQCANRTNSGLSYFVATVVWLLLLACGARSLLHNKFTERFGLAILLMLSSQVALHLLYGEETFLYALHFSPLLVVLAAGVFLQPYKLLPALLLVGLVFFAIVNNAARLVDALDNGKSNVIDVRIISRNIR